MKKPNIITAAILVFLMTSCDTYYQANSKINKDGSMSREILAKADSSEIARKEWSSIFMFDTENWNIGETVPEVKYRTAGNGDYTFNIKASRTYDIIDGELSYVNDSIDGLKNILAPKEKVNKRFGWFYTYYEYNAQFSRLKLKLPVDIDKYLTDWEQKIWFENINELPDGSNGIETYMILSDIQNKFDRWTAHCQFSISLGIIMEIDSAEYAGKYHNELAGEEDILFRNISQLVNDKDNYSVNEVCDAFDKLFGTAYFSRLLSENSEYANKAENERSMIFNIANYHQKFVMEMPGKIYKSNVRQTSDNQTEWMMDAYRLINSDSEISVKSRTVNYWAFAVTIVILLLPVFLLRKRR